MRMLRDPPALKTCEKFDWLIGVILAGVLNNLDHATVCLIVLNFI